MDEEVLFDDADRSTQSSTSIEVVIEQLDIDKGDSKEVPQIDGQEIYDFEIDNMEDKPWEKPGADITDYFNYGFNERTWKKYCIAQREFVKGINAPRKKARDERGARKGEDQDQKRADRTSKTSDTKSSERSERRYITRGGRTKKEEQRERNRSKREYPREKRYRRRK